MLVKIVVIYGIWLVIYYKKYSLNLLLVYGVEFNEVWRYLRDVVLRCVELVIWWNEVRVVIEV